MRYQTKTFINIGLLGAALSLGLAGCSSSATKAPDNNLAANSIPSPSPTPEVTPTVEDLTVSPTPLPAAPVAAAPAGSGATRPAAPPRRNAAPAPPPREEPPARTVRTYTLPAGTAIAVSLESDLSTKKNKSGDRFTGSLAESLSDGDYVIARRGAPVEGEVVDADPGGRVKGTATMSIRLVSLTLADGRKVGISTSSYTKEAKSSKGKDAAKIGAGAGIGAAIGAIAGGGKGAAIGAAIGGGAGTGAVLGTRGDPAVIPSESPVTMKLTSPVSVTRR